MTLKPAVSDPQGRTVLATLTNLGFGAARDIRVGKYLEVRIDEVDPGAAGLLVERMCETLLANPVIEEFRYELEPVPEEE